MREASKWMPAPALRCRARRCCCIAHPLPTSFAGPLRRRCAMRGRESVRGDSLVFDRFRPADTAARGYLCKIFSTQATMRRRVIRAGKIGCDGPPILLLIASSEKCATCRNSLFHRIFCNRREFAACRCRRIATMRTIDAAKRAPHAFRCIIDAAHTRFLKWNAAFFVVL